MKKWEVARYFIDAKKCIDSVWFIAENADQIYNINLRKKIDDLLRTFYINCCVVLDQMKNKKVLCSEDEIIERIYYERDKDKAHKDANYTPIKYSSFIELRDIMQEQLLTVYKRSSSVLPEDITVDFVPHDKELFRLAHSITPEIEKKIKSAKYPLYNKSCDLNNSCNETRIIFQDTEDLRDIPEEKRNEYGVVIEGGINYYEMLQELQDGWIKINVLYETNMWASFKSGSVEQLKRLTDLGIIDEYGIPALLDDNNQEAIEEFIKFIQGENRVET